MSWGQSGPSRLVVALVCISALLLGAVVFVWRAELFPILPFGAHLVPAEGGPSGSAQELFRQHILDPIPQSVTEIKADRLRKSSGYGCVFRFKISKADVGLIVNSRPFVNATQAEYRNGILHWEYAPGLSRTKVIYASDLRRPRWFELQRWNHFKAYVLDEGDKYNEESLHILLYNEDLEEAYFIVAWGN